MQNVINWGAGASPYIEDTSPPYGFGVQLYSVTYNGNGNTGGSIPVDPVAYASGQTVTVLGNTGNLSISGYVFDHWNTAANGLGTSYSAGNIFAMSTANVILYAIYNAVYSVTYYANGASGSVPVDSSAYLHGATVTTLGNTGPLTYPSYSFNGWNTAANGSGTQHSPGTTFLVGYANVALYAQWLPTYTITYSGNGNTGGTAPTDSNSYLNGASAVVANNSGSLVKTSYAFIGWNTLANGSGTTYSPGSSYIVGASNIVLYAKWAPTYPVTYNGNGNTGGSIPVDGNLYQTGQTVTVLANTGNLSKTNGSFIGWNTAANGSGNSYGATGTSTFVIGSSNVVLYAQWASVTYTITYVGQGATGGSAPVDSNLYLSGSQATVLGNIGNLINPPYLFNGWNTQPGGGGTAYTAGELITFPSSNVVLYSQWASSAQNLGGIHYLRQSTDGQIIPLGPFLSSTDFNTELTSLTIINTNIHIWRSGASTLPVCHASGATHIANGVYYVTLDATDTAVVGGIKIYVHVTGALPVSYEASILSGAVYDSIFGSIALATAGSQMALTATEESNIQNKILSDATPFAGSGVGLIISKLGALPDHVAAVGSPMTLEDGAVNSASIAINAIGTAQAPNLDAPVSSRLAAASYSPFDPSELTTILNYLELIGVAVSSIKAKTDPLPPLPAAIGSAMTLLNSERQNIASTIMSTDVEGSETLAEVIRLMRAVLLGITTGGINGPYSFMSKDGNTVRVNVTVNSLQDRTRVITDGL
jgi:hypothetical protein